MRSLHRGGKASSRVARTTNGTGASGSLGEGAVEPVHGDGGVVPDGEDEHHLLELLAHLGQAALGAKVVGVVKGRLLGGAKVLGDAVAGDARDLGLAVGDSLAALDVEALDLGQGAGGGAVVGDELGDDGEGLGGVEGQAGAVKGLVAHAVRVEVAAALVAVALAAGVAVTAGGGVGAAGLAVGGARVGGQGGGDGVGLPGGTGQPCLIKGDVWDWRERAKERERERGSLPDVHLGAARSISTSSSVGASSVPALNIGLAVDELDVVRALRVTVSGSVLGTSLVGGELGHATIGVHLTEVDSTVQAARQLRHIHVKGELLVEQVEHAVLGVRSHQVGTRTDVAAVGVLGDKVELQGTGARGGDAVGATVVCTIDRAVCGAGRAIWAERCVPGVARVAVCVSAGGVRPAPVGIKRDLGLLRLAAAGGRARLDGERRVCLGSESAR